MWSAGLGGRATKSGTQDSLQTLVSRPVPIVFRKSDMSRGFVAMILRHPYDGEYFRRSSKGEVWL